MPHKPRKRLLKLASLLFLLAVALTSCQTEKREATEETVTIVFKHGKLAGGPEALRAILARFEAENPDIKVKDEVLPASTDEQHQFYVINLEAGSPEFDVLSMDVIWVEEFARAGWLRPLDGIFPPEEREDFFAGPISAVTYQGSVYAIPWYIDAGLLYYRKDLLEKYSMPVPRTWQELVSTAKLIMEKEKDIYGFIWQGKQYEGLVCNVMEYMWSRGGGLIDEDGRFNALKKENIEALQFIYDLIHTYRVSPPLVTTAMEETTRHIFGSGRAIFMRNWPYAWKIFEREGSTVKGKVGVTVLPAFEGYNSAATLGGWQLGVNRYSPHPEAAERLVRYLTSYEVQKEMSIKMGYRPPRRSLYEDEELRRAQPFIVELYPVFERARPRPETPYYMMITQVLQPEFSAAITGLKSPEEALRSIQRQVEYILKLEER